MAPFFIQSKKKCMKHQFDLFIAGLALTVLGLLIRYSIGRRRFNRRSPFGLQQYHSYKEALGTRAGEGCAAGFGALLILAGILLTLAGLA
jgi:hypothetical protein